MENFLPQWIIHTISICVQLLSLPVIFITGRSVYRYRKENTAHRSFLGLTVALSIWLILNIAGTGISLLHLQYGKWISIAAEISLLSIAPLTLYTGLHFPPGKRVSRSRLPITQRLLRYLLPDIIAIALALFSLFGPGNSLNTQYPVHDVYLYLNRLFAALTVAWVIAIQKGLYENSENKPRKIHIKLFIIGNSGLLAALLAGIISLLIYDSLEISNAVSGFLLAIAVFELGRVFENRPVDYMAFVSRSVPVLVTGGIAFIVTLVVSSSITTSLPLIPVAASITIILAAAIHATIDKHITDITDPVYFKYMMERKAVRSVEGAQREGKRLTLHFFNELFHPGVFALYLRETQSGDEDSYLILEQDSIIQKTESRNLPGVFPEEILEFLNRIRGIHAGGALLADLIAHSEKWGMDGMRRMLQGLATSGIEILVPVFDIQDRDIEDNETGVESRIYNAMILAGELPDRKPFDHGHLSRIRSVAPLLHMGLQNEALGSYVRRLREKMEEDNKRISRSVGERSAERSSDLSAASFVYRPDGRMAEIMEQVERFAHRNAPVLISGGTGTGKEHIARIIHILSGVSGNFVAFNSSAIPQDLIENELFGHAKGAYTGADEATDGFVGKAKGGILFMDEIGELSLEGQVKLLRLVQDGEYEKLGSSETQKTDARLIFATNRNLEDEVQRGSFRSDLYYRISTFEIEIPALRERKEDIPFLTDHFLWIARETFHRPALTITARARELLTKYSWPGNVRELENVIMRAVVLNDSDTIDVSNLPDELREEADFTRKKLQLEKILQEQARLERELVIEALARSGGNQRAAAEILNISRGALQYRMKQYGLTQES